MTKYFSIRIVILFLCNKIEETKKNLLYCLFFVVALIALICIYFLKIVLIRIINSKSKNAYNIPHTTVNLKVMDPNYT